ncbi:MAG: hypothetical protein IPL28_23645 [Chloroflexi bacterium]|nr:hypothetical protein [Chloroflexota bacterium]
MYWVTVQILAIGVNGWNKKNLQGLGELAGLWGARATLGQVHHSDNSFAGHGRLGWW